MTELSDEARRLIEAATRDDGPSEERIDAIGPGLFRKLGAGAAVLSSAKVAAATAAPAGSALKITGVVGYFVLGGAAGVGVAVTAATLGMFRASSPELGSAALAPARSPSAERASAHPGAASGVGPRPLDVSPATQPSARAQGSSARHGAPENRESTLNDEVEQLRAIHGFLAAGEGSRALAASDRYFAEYRSGALRDEHVAARVLALCLLGDVMRARDAARMFVARSPASPLLPRLARSCVADVIGSDQRQGQ